MTEHTHGPWFFDKDLMTVWAYEVGGVRMDKARMQVANIRGHGRLMYRDDGMEVQAANARLIVAAPDLLEALEALWKQALQSELNSHANEWGMEAIEMATSAIAKAKGKAND